MADVKALAALTEQISAAATEHIWQAPVDLFQKGSGTIPALPPGCLPRVLDTFAFDAPLDAYPTAIAMASLVACSSIIGNTFHVRISPSWDTRLILWTLLIGSSGSGKTPIFSRVMRAIRHIQAESVANHRRTVAAQLEAGVERRDLAPMPPRYWTQDATLASISELLKEDRSPHGILLANDEVSSWLVSLSSERSSNKEDSGAWLRGYDGGYSSVDRVMRGEIHISNWAINLLGAGTTDKISAIAKNMVADGLFARAQIVMMPPITPNSVPETDSGSIAAFDTLLSDKLNTIRLSYAAPIELTFTADAHRKFYEYREQYQLQALDESDYLPRYAERINKLPGLLAKVAGLFHVINCAEAAPVRTGAPFQGEVSARVPITTLDQAHKFLEHMQLHDEAFYRVLSNTDESPGTMLAREIAKFILRQEATEFKIGDITRNVTMPSTLRNSDKVHALLMLENLGWTHTTAGEIARGMELIRGTVWTVNPAVHTVFKARAELLKRKAARDVEAIRASASSRRAEELGE